MHIRDIQVSKLSQAPAQEGRHDQPAPTLFRPRLRDTPDKAGQDQTRPGEARPHRVEGTEANVHERPGEPDNKTASKLQNRTFGWPFLARNEARPPHMHMARIRTQVSYLHESTEYNSMPLMSYMHAEETSIKGLEWRLRRLLLAGGSCWSNQHKQSRCRPRPRRLPCLGGEKWRHNVLRACCVLHPKSCSRGAQGSTMEYWNTTTALLFQLLTAKHLGRRQPASTREQQQCFVFLSFCPGPPSLISWRRLPLQKGGKIII